MVCSQQLRRLARLEQGYRRKKRERANDEEVPGEGIRGASGAICVCCRIVRTAGLRSSRTGGVAYRSGIRRQELLGNRRANSKRLAVESIWHADRSFDFSFLAGGHQSFLDEPGVSQSHRAVLPGSL